MRNLNKPPRYNVASIQAQQTLGGDVMQADENGQYVEWRDYKWLLAEVERLRASSFVTAVPSEEYEKLKAEVERLQNNCDYIDQKLDEEIDKSAWLCGQVERLRKAGDELLHEWSSGDETDGRNFKKGLVLWNAAKEGKQP